MKGNRAPAGGRILIVDDDPQICAVLEEFLAVKGYEARSVADGESALHAVSQEIPDVVLLDIVMPGMGGLEVLPAIRARAPATKVIMVSGRATLEEAKQTLVSGAFDYIVKPIDMTYLGRSVETALLWKWVAAEEAWGQA